MCKCEEGHNWRLLDEWIEEDGYWQHWHCNTCGINKLIDTYWDPDPHTTKEDLKHRLGIKNELRTQMGTNTVRP